MHFGDTSAPEFSVESSTSITAISPPGAGAVDVTVTTPRGTSVTGEADLYRYGPPVTLTASPNPSVYGQKVTFSAKVAPLTEGAPAPTGSVAFREGTSTLGVVGLRKGTATLNTKALGAGKHPVIAVYSGDANFGADESEVATVVVAAAKTRTTLTSSLDPAPFGSSGKLEATVEPVEPGAGTQAGTVTFREGETVLGAVQLHGHLATLPLKELTPGTHQISAVYGGDANDEPSTASSYVQTIVKAATETAASSTLSPAPFGSSADIKATIKAVAPGGGTPTGTVTFREGETVLATIPLAGKTAKLPIGELSPGTHLITEKFNGSSEYEASEAEFEQVVTEAETTLTLTSTRNPAPKGGSGRLRATLKVVSPGAGSPTGSIVFREGEAILATIPVSNRVATFPLSALPAGEHQIVASYIGNANYMASEGSLVQVVEP